MLVGYVLMCDVSNSFYCFVCLVMGSADCDPAWVQTAVTDLKHLSQKVKKHAISQKHLFYSVEFGILGNTDLRNQLSGVYRLEIQKHNEKVKQNRYTGLFTRGVFLNFFLPQPIIHIATIS
jgi:hypothetical protein